jgi:carboxypeptidase C (cathepsin A)
MRTLAQLCFLVVLSTFPLGAQSTRRPESARVQSVETVSPATAPAEEKLASTSHSVRIDGAAVQYTATAGTLVLKDAKGKQTAGMFFVAYVREGTQDLHSRPITFCYNGGPGAATIWLHMGSFGPRRVQMAEEGFQPAPPFELVENESSLLDVTDLVFVDAVSTGFSRAIDDPKPFHGVRGDLQAFGDFIRMYLTRFNRWSSPKYLLGESYGTMRSAGLSGELQARHGIELNGIVLISSVIDFQTLSAAPGNDLPYSTFLPTFTATAWYHKRLPPDLQGDLKKAVDESRRFAFGEYVQALVRGNLLSEVERKTVAQKVARLSGLSAEFVLRSNLRVSAARFRKELLRDRRLMVGRLDGRFTGLDADAAGESQEFDPSNTALQGAYTALFSDYVRRQLKWESDLRYETSGNVRPWSYDEFENRYLNLSDTLRQSMARNPFLRVLVCNGYYDMATPFGGTEYTFAHLGFDPTYRERVALTYYEAGHMMYIRPSALKQVKQDIARFLRAAANGQPRAGASQ